MSKSLRDEMLELDDGALRAIVKAHIDAGVCWWGTDEDWRCGNQREHHKAEAAHEARSLKRSWAKSQEPGAAPSHYPGIQTLTIKSVLAWEVKPGMVMEHHGKPGSDAITEYVEVLSNPDRGHAVVFRRTNDPEARRFTIAYRSDESVRVWIVTPVKKEGS